MVRVPFSPDEDPLANLLSVIVRTAVAPVNTRLVIGAVRYPPDNRRCTAAHALTFTALEADNPITLDFVGFRKN
jgi:hypothetical protein